MLHDGVGDRRASAALDAARWTVPSLSAIVSLVLMLSLPGETWTRLLVWMGVGVAIYFSYSYKRSRLLAQP